MKKKLGYIFFLLILIGNHHASYANKPRPTQKHILATMTVAVAATYATRFAYEWYNGKYERAWDIVEELNHQDYEFVMSLVAEIFKFYKHYSASITWTPKDIKDYMGNVSDYAGKAKDISTQQLERFRNFLSTYQRKKQ